MDYILSQTSIGCLNPVGRTQVDSSGDSKIIECLSDLAAKKIVQHVEWTKIALEYVPHTVYTHLLRAALILNREQSIPLLIHSWPLRIISLSDVLGQSLHPNISAYLNDVSNLDRFRTSLLQTASLISFFISAIKSSHAEPINCRELNLVGYPSAEAVVLYLSANLQLIENQRFQDLILSKVSQLCETQGYSLPPAIQAKFDQTANQMRDVAQSNASVTKPFCVPKNRYKVRLDISVPNEDVYKSLLLALKISNDEDDVLLTMEIDKLDINSLHGHQVIELMKAINSELHGLSLSLCRFETESPKEFCELLLKFRNLSSFGLSYFIWHRNYRSELFTHLTSALSQMSLLQRLDLSGTLSHGHLRDLLNGINHLDIRYLNLSACCLRHSDYIYLSSRECNLRNTITDLILNDNSTNQVVDPRPSIVHCFAAGWPNLEVLQLTDMDLPDEFLLPFVEALVNGSPRLSLLDLSNNKSAGCQGLASAVERLVHHPRLRYLHLSLPYDFFGRGDVNADNDDEDEDENIYQVVDINQRKLFVDRLNTAVLRFNPNLKIIFTDWE